MNEFGSEAASKCTHCRIDAKTAMDHPWITEHSNSNRSLADQVKSLGITTTKRKLRRAVSKILFMRKIVMVMKGSVGGAVLSKQQTEDMKRKSSPNKKKDAEKDKGCCTIA